MTDRKQLVEQRRYPRFQVPSLSAYVLLRPHCTRVGPIVDVSMDGLAFCCLATEELSNNNSSELDIFLPGRAFHLYKVPFKTISDLETAAEIPFSSMTTMTMRRDGVQFGDLTDHQKSDLRRFIETYTTADSEA